MGKRRLC